MEKVFVQFSDETEGVIQAVFSCAQDSEVYPNQGELPSDDPRYVTFYEGLAPGMVRGMITPGQ